jgi:hypothetical protein
VTGRADQHAVSAALRLVAEAPHELSEDELKRLLLDAADVIETLHKLVAIRDDILLEDGPAAGNA